MNLQRFVRALARGHTRGLARESQLAAVYERIIRNQAAKSARALVSEAGLTAAVAPRDWQPPPEGVIFTDVGVTVALTRQQLQAVETVVRPALEQVGIAWNPDDPRLRELLAQTGEWSGQAISDAMLPQLRKLVADAFRDGLPVKDAAALIRTRFAETAPWQAAMLARSNLNMLGNAGMQHAVTRYNETARATGDRQVQTKTWTTAGDSAVRPTHVAAGGQTVPVDQSFHVGGSLLSFPGDPGGSPGEVLNCRCVALYGSASRSSLTAAVRSPVVGKVRQRPGRKAATRHKLKVAATAPKYERRDDVTAAAIPAVGWVSDLAFEGAATSDGRYMLPKSIAWRDLPLTLMAMTVTDDGHDGAFVAGRIDKVNRSSSDIDGQKLPDGITSIRAGGIFDMGGENGAEIARLVGDETLRGVSIDLAILDWAFRDPDTGELIEPTDMTEEQMDRAFFGELQYAVKSGELLAATVCPTPAFADAKIALAASGEPLLQITTTFELVGDALAAAAAPVAPPREWFFADEPSQPTPLTVTDDGRIFGHIAAWGSCYVGRPGECFQPPSSPSKYAYFNLGEITCKDGSAVACGQITMDAFHAPIRPGIGWKEAKAHYEKTGLCVADVRAVDGLHGIFVAGALRPHLSDDQIRELRGAKPSGDWRQITPGGPLELVGVLEVNHPGYPVPRPQLAMVASAAHPEGEPIALIASGIVGDDEFDRRLRVLEAREQGVDGLAALIG